MKKNFEKLEKIIFYLLVFCVPLQLRRIFFVWGENFNEWQGIYLYATDILILALLVLWLWRVKKPTKPDGLEKALLIFLFFSAISLFSASNLWLGIYSFSKLLEFAFLFLYLKYNFSKIFDARKFWLVFCSGAVLQGLLAVAQFLKQGSLGLKFLTESPLSPDLAGVAKIVLDGEKMIRAYGLTPHPNILAAILAVAIFGVGYLFLGHSDPAAAGEESPRILRDSESLAKAGRSFASLRMTRIIIFILLFFLLIFALFLTFSRAILISAFLFFSLWLIFFRRQPEFKKSIKVLFWIFVICYMFCVVCFWPFLSARFSDLKAGEQAVDLRLFLNGAAGEFLKQNPILGVGQGNFVFELGQKFPDLPLWQFQPVHNIYLLAATETGLLGLLAFLAFLFLTLKSAWLCPVMSEANFTGSRFKNLSVSCLLFIIFFLLSTGLADHFLWDLQQGQLLFWISLGILASLSARGSTDRAQASGA